MSIEKIHSKSKESGLKKTSKLKCIIVGSGNIGALYDTPGTAEILSFAHAISRNSGFDLVALVDNDAETKEYASKLWGVQGYFELKEAVQELGVPDVIVSCVPDDLHLKVLQECLDYEPRYIVTEKPLATDLVECYDLEQVVFTKSSEVIVNYSRRYIKAYIELQKRIRNNEFGKFLCGTGYYGKGLLHNGSHMLDMLNFFIDPYYKDVVNIHKKNDDFSDKDLSISSTLYFQDDSYFTMNAIDFRLFSIFEFDLIFEKGRIEFKDGGFNINIYIKAEDSIYENQSVLVLADSLKISKSEPLIGLTNQILNHFEGEDIKFCSVEDGIKVMELWEKLNQY